MKNKAHTATLNRICRKLGVVPSEKFDIQTDDMIIEVETSATIAEAVERLKGQSVHCYIAVTNKEGIKLAVTTATGTGVGVMDPQGEIVLECGSAEVATECGSTNQDDMEVANPPRLGPGVAHHEGGVANCTFSNPASRAAS